MSCIVLLMERWCSLTFTPEILCTWCCGHSVLLISVLFLGSHGLVVVCFLPCLPPWQINWMCGRTQYWMEAIRLLWIFCCPLESTFRWMFPERAPSNKSSRCVGIINHYLTLLTISPPVCAHLFLVVFLYLVNFRFAIISLVYSLVVSRL